MMNFALLPLMRKQFLNFPTIDFWEARQDSQFRNETK